jgi:hypothetical protein
LINYPLSEKRFPTCKSVASYLQIAKCKCNCKCNCKSLASHLQVTCKSLATCENLHICKCRHAKVSNRKVSARRC